MRHARPDYDRIQDPAAEGERDIYEFLGRLTETYTAGGGPFAGPTGELLRETERAILSEVVDFFGNAGSEVLARVRAFAARAELPEGSTPFGADEPVFLVRGQDVCAPGAIRGWSELARVAGASAAMVRTAVDHADETERWQDSGEGEGRVRRVPDMPEPEVEHRGSRA